MNTILLIIVFYLVAIFGIAWVFSRKGSISKYFLNEKSTGIWVLTLSTVSSVIGAGATIGIIAEVYNTGISYGIGLPISFIAGMVIMAFFAKKIKEIGDIYNAYTISDLFDAKFGSNTRRISSIIQVVMMIVWAALQVVAFASLAAVLTGVSYQLAIILVSLITIAYTAIGGLKVDMITDFVQFWVIIVVFFVMIILGLNSVGGFTELLSSIPREHLNPVAFGGVSWLVGVVVLSGFLYLGQAPHWQRIFSAKSIDVAKKAYINTGFIIGAFAVIIVFLGLIARVILGEGLVPEQVPFELMRMILPPWVLGIGFAAILAVVMSSIDSILIGASTIIYREMEKERTRILKLNDMVLARTITALFGVVAFLLAFLMPNIVSLSLLSVYFAILFIPPVLAGFYSKKISATAINISLIASSVSLVVLFPIMNQNSFIIPTILSAMIVLFYDKVRRRTDLQK